MPYAEDVILKYTIMREMVYSFFSFLLDLVVVPRHSELAVRTLTPNTLRALAARHNTQHNEHISILPYHEERVTALVWEVKYYKNRRAAALAGEILQETLLAIASESLGRPLLIPIPMHRSRRRERGHNQTEVLCEAALDIGDRYFRRKVWPTKGRRPEDFSERIPVGNILEYYPTVLTRIKNTSPQQGLAKYSRLSNVKNSMYVTHPELVVGRTCIVVDDVATTGATFAEARRALCAAGASAVECVALAGS